MRRLAVTLLLAAVGCSSSGGGGSSPGDSGGEESNDAGTRKKDSGAAKTDSGSAAKDSGPRSDGGDDLDGPAPGSITEFTVGGTPTQITLGPDGHLWFTAETFQNMGGIDRINTITLSGVTLTEFPVPMSSYGPLGITSGPDGNLWFTSTTDPNVGRITPSGTITEFPVPAISSGITSGPDGSLWFTTTSSGDGGLVDDIGQLAPDGGVSELPVPPGANLHFVNGAALTGFGITSGPDGNLWFTERDGNDIGRVTPSGTITVFPVPTATCTCNQHRCCGRRLSMGYGLRRQ